jgi:amino acid transporter
MAIALVVGTVIGSGVFKKPQVIAENVPYFGLVAIVWILGGLLALLGGLALAEVGVLFPRSGGNYVFLREGFGRLPAFLYGWVEFWISRSASLAALATIFTESLYNLIKPTSVAAGHTLSDFDFWLLRWLTVALLMGLGLINVLGVRWGGVLQPAHGSGPDQRAGSAVGRGLTTSRDPGQGGFAAGHPGLALRGAGAGAAGGPRARAQHR